MRGWGAPQKGPVRPEQRKVERTERWSPEIRDVKVLLRLHTEHSGAGLIQTRTTVLNPPEAPLVTALAMRWGCSITKGVFISPAHSSAGRFVASSRKGMPVTTGQGLCQLADTRRLHSQPCRAATHSPVTLSSPPPLPVPPHPMRQTRKSMLEEKQAKM